MTLQTEAHGQCCAPPTGHDRKHKQRRQVFLAKNMQHRRRSKKRTSGCTKNTRSPKREDVRVSWGYGAGFGSAVMSGLETLRRGDDGRESASPAADCASFFHFTPVFQKLQQSFMYFKLCASLGSSARTQRGGWGAAGHSFWQMYGKHPCRGRRPDAPRSSTPFFAKRPANPQPPL